MKNELRQNQSEYHCLLKQYEIKVEECKKANILIEHFIDTINKKEIYKDTFHPSSHEIVSQNSFKS
jgi:hypothetical protein